jgi:hypothetical protein
MDAIIGRYKVRMDETGLVLKHPTGISIDFRPNEVIGLWRFIDFYREQLSDLQLDTKPQLETTETEKLFDPKSRWRDR